MRGRSRRSDPSGAAGSARCARSARSPSSSRPWRSASCSMPRARRSLFWAYLPFLVATAVVTATIPRRAGATRSVSLLRGAGDFLSTQGVALFLVGFTVVWASLAAVTAFYSIQVVALGGSPGLVGIAWAVGAAIEVPYMYAFPRVAGLVRDGAAGRRRLARLRVAWPAGGAGRRPGRARVHRASRGARLRERLRGRRDGAGRTCADGPAGHRSGPVRRLFRAGHDHRVVRRRGAARWGLGVPAGGRPPVGIAPAWSGRPIRRRPGTPRRPDASAHVRTRPATPAGQPPRPRDPRCTPPTASASAAGQRPPALAVPLSRAAPPRRPRARGR